MQIPLYYWLREQDSNLRPLGYEPNELPTAPSRDVIDNIYFTILCECCQYLYYNYMKKTRKYSLINKNYTSKV